MDFDTQAFGNRIELAAKRQGIKISEIEKINSWSPGLIRTRWLKQKSIPGADKILELARTLNVSTDYLLGFGSYSDATEDDIEELDPKAFRISERFRDKEKSSDFVKALVADTQTRYLTWYKLSDEYDIFRPKDVKQLFTPKKFRNRVAYYCEENVDSFLFTAEWDRIDCDDLETPYELKLFISPNDMGMVQSDENQSSLLELLEFINFKLYDHLIKTNATLIKDKYTKGFYKRQSI